MDRLSVWSVTNRVIFAGLSIAFCIAGLVLWCYDARKMEGLFDIVTRSGNIVLSSVSVSFIIMEIVDMVLGIYESIKKKNYELGYQAGRQAALKQQSGEDQAGADSNAAERAESPTPGPNPDE